MDVNNPIKNNISDNKKDFLKNIFKLSFWKRTSISFSEIIVKYKQSEINIPKILVWESRNKITDILIIFFLRFSNNVQKMNKSNTLRL